MELFFQIIAIFLTSITFSWEDKGIKYSDLNSGDYDEGGTIVFFNFVAILSLIFLACVLTYCIIWSPKLISTRMVRHLKNFFISLIYANALFFIQWITIRLNRFLQNHEFHKHISFPLLILSVFPYYFDGFITFSLNNQSLIREIKCSPLKKFAAL